MVRGDSQTKSVPGPRVTGLMGIAVARHGGRGGCSRIRRQEVSQIWELGGVYGARPGPLQHVNPRHSGAPRQLQKAFQKSRRKGSNAGPA